MRKKNNRPNYRDRFAVYIRDLDYFGDMKVVRLKSAVGGWRVIIAGRDLSPCFSDWATMRLRASYKADERLAALGGRHVRKYDDSGTARQSVTYWHHLASSGAGVAAAEEGTDDIVVSTGGFRSWSWEATSFPSASPPLPSSLLSFSFPFPPLSLVQLGGLRSAVSSPAEPGRQRFFDQFD